ncbi:MAG: hypothetical protein R3B41_02885 [Candidatus Doudnabacteria bacterium]
MPQETKTNNQETFYNVMPEITSNSGSSTKPKPVTLATPTTQAKPSDLKSSSQDQKPGATPSVPQKPPTSNKPINIPPQPQTQILFKILAILGVSVFVLGLIIIATYSLERKNALKDSSEDVAQDNSAEEQLNPEVTTNPGWLEKYFGSTVCTEISVCGDLSDPDRDGLENIKEFGLGSDPNNPDGDNDGIADGDEINIFNSDPLLRQTYREGEYNDQDFIKGGYDILTNQPYTPDRLIQIKLAVANFGLHQPTIATLGEVAFDLYEYKDPNGPQLPADLDLSPEAKLDRDSQRQSTIKKIGTALLKFKEEETEFPPTEDFVMMSDLVKPYNTLATNYNDPISIDPYNYGYQATNANKSFTLTYYSETQSQLIKYTDQDAAEDAEEENGKAEDEIRKSDVEAIAAALKVYSSIQLQPDSVVSNIFPPLENYKTELVPKYLTVLPTDPLTKLDYTYEVGPTKETFSVKTFLSNPTAGTTGYMCDQISCKPF